MVSARNFSKALNLIYGKADISASGAHILRHTYASMLFEKGINVKVISKLLGHSRVEITLNKYIHLIKEQEIDAVNVLNELKEAKIL